MTEPLHTPGHVADSALRVLAFYLPQYHPIPENDRAWGKGFTDWRNVAKARPRFPGHEQPHIPADMGFYDLRVPEVRAAQADLARAHRIDGFCYYHYWFSGRRLLEKPFEEVLESGEPDFPFALCWANEAWTRNWDGLSGTVIVPQGHSADDDRAHARALLPAFADRRYVRVGGRPLFLVYRAQLLPDPRQSTDIWREEVTRSGLPEPYLCRVESFGDERGDPAALGFDAAVEFQPDWTTIQSKRTRNVLAMTRGSVLHPRRRDRVFTYAQLVAAAEAKPQAPYRRHPCVTPMWDNTARRSRGATIFHGAEPDLYGKWLREEARTELGRSEPRLLFVNAWNEWAEGCHLEPCERYGRTYLEKTRDVLGSL